RGDLLQALAVGLGLDLAGNATAARGIGHQHAVAACQRQIGGQRRALVAALFLDDLHQHDLPALDDFLDLVAPEGIGAAAAAMAFLVIVAFAVLAILTVLVGAGVRLRCGITGLVVTPVLLRSICLAGRLMSVIVMIDVLCLFAGLIRVAFGSLHRRGDGRCRLRAGRDIPVGRRGDRL